MTLRLISSRLDRCSRCTTVPELLRQGDGFPAVHVGHGPGKRELADVQLRRNARLDGDERGAGDEITLSQQCGADGALRR